MRVIRSKTICCVIAFCLGLVPIMAFANSTDWISGEFRMATLSRIATKLYYLDSEESMKECEPLLNRLSKTCAFKLDPASRTTVDFYRKAEVVDPASPNPLSNYKKVGEVRVSQAGEYIFLLLPEYEGIRGASEIKSLRIGVIKDQFGREGGSSWLLVNTTDQAIYARLGEGSDPVVLAGKAQKLVEPSQSREFDLIQFAANIEGDDRLFYSGVWPTYEHSNYLVIFQQDANSKRIAVKRISGGG